MKIELRKIPVRKLVEGYTDDGEGGVIGYGGHLDIRPPYQREFVYKDSQRDAVINSIRKDYPLNVMYWAVRPDGRYEVIDGQQRTISIAQYLQVPEGFSIENGVYFETLTDDQQEQILNYELMVYVCEGTDSEKLDWFKIINIAGEKLTPQELRNAVYAGSWVSHAKRYFSRSNQGAYKIGKDYMNGSPIRQEYLETAIRWHKDNGETIEEYMGRHMHDHTAVELWGYFRSVIDWIEATFTKKRTNLMKGRDWGRLYKEHGHRNDLDPEKIEKATARLIKDKHEVQDQKGIYEYILTGNEKHLNLRVFDDYQKQRAYEKQGEKCKNCGNPFPLSEMEGDHIIPWSEKGKTVDENCQMLCHECHEEKTVRQARRKAARSSADAS